MAHRSSTALEAYLATCPAEVLFDLSQILGDRLGFNGMRQRLQSPSDIPSGEDREALAHDLVAELGYFGSNNLAYLARRTLGSEKAVGYGEVLYDVVKFLNGELKKKLNVPRVASVKDREQMVCSQLLGIAFQDKTEGQISQMLTEAGLDQEAKKAAAIKAAVQGGSGALVIALVKILGKKTVTAFLAATVIRLVALKVGKEAAEKLVFRVLQKVPQKAFAAFTARRRCRNGVSSSRIQFLRSTGMECLRRLLFKKQGVTQPIAHRRPPCTATAWVGRTPAGAAVRTH